MTLVKLFLASILLAPLLNMGQVRAHLLRADQQIGAVLHIEPDDNPLSGKQVQYVLSFQDTSKRFSLKNCDCIVEYTLNNEVVATVPLQTSAPLDSLNTFVFTAPGSYTLRVIGEPKQGNEFQPFILEYEVRVVSGEIVLQNMPVLLIAGLAMIMGAIILAAYVGDNSNEIGNKQ